MDPTTSERKVVIITGSTSSIGCDLAEHLHAKGYNVVVSGRRIKEGQAIASQLDFTWDTAIFVQCDVTSYDSQANLFKTAWAKWHRLDALVANAGFVDQTSHYNLNSKAVPICEIPPEPNLSCTDVNFKAVVLGTEMAVHYMRHNPVQARGGKIVITNSVSGLYPVPMAPEYSAAKAAALQWARSVAPMLGLEGITINSVLPNVYDTDIMPGFQEAFLDEHLTKKYCLLSAYDVFLDDAAGEKNGQAIETACESHYYHDEPPFKSGKVIERTVKTYEPWFGILHGTTSGLANTIKGPLRTVAK
ncbi:hypothetical protein Daus18300_009842 [Diaporthe australafricana]|uniref:Uncharacterized protein n=1 Tax=Diaporthe australafricana TaxID=127596 RepID=A0ABR3WCM9_9PEZI